MRGWLEEVVGSGGFVSASADAEDVALSRTSLYPFDMLLWNHADGQWNDALLRNALGLNVPVILFGELLTVDERMRMMKMGVNDYITMPVHAMELLARIEIVLERRGNAADSVLVVEDVIVRPVDHIVTKNGRIVHLTPREYALLAFLLQNRNIVFSRERLLMEVWGIGEVEAGEVLGNGTRTVEAHILRIRRKLGLETSLQTVYRAGYRMLDPDSIG